MRDSFINEENNDRPISKDSSFNSNKIENKCVEDDYDNDNDDDDDDDDDEQIDVNICFIINFKLYNL